MVCTGLETRANQESVYSRAGLGAGPPCNLQPPGTRSLQVARRQRRRDRKRMIFCRQTGGTVLALVVVAENISFRSDQMADVLFIVITVLFFAVACLYVRGCDRL